jgi:hypothetical protein
MSAPRVAKWENAYEYTRDQVTGLKYPLVGRAGSVTNLKAEFIDLDPDRFIAQVTDDKANANPQQKDTLRAAVQTLGESGLRWMTLTETGNNTGVFQSKSLILVSDELDDTLRVDGVADNADEDRTFRTKSFFSNNASSFTTAPG